MYNKKLIFQDQIFEEGMTIPANTNDTGTYAQRVNGSNGNLAITVVAATTVNVANGQTITLNYTQSDTYAGSYAAPADAVSLVRTLGAALVAEAGTVIARLLLPTDVGDYIKAKIATNDAGATGTIDLFLEYIGG